MGGVLSKSKPAEQPASELPVEQTLSTSTTTTTAIDSKPDVQDEEQLQQVEARGRKDAEEPRQVLKATPAKAPSAGKKASTSSALPDDIAAILSGGHNIGDETLSNAIDTFTSTAAKSATSSSQNISDAVADLKAKFGINAGPLREGELDGIRQEIEASNRESELKERLKRARVAKERMALHGKESKEE